MLRTLALLGAAVACSVGHAGEKQSAARKWLGKDVAAILDGAERVETFRVKEDFATPEEREKTKDQRIAGRLRLGQGKDLTKEQMATLRRTALSDRSYGWDFAKGCIPMPGVVFRVHSKKTYVDVVMCYECSEWSFVPAGGGKAQWEDFDPAERLLIALAKAAFPEDEAIQGL